MMLNFHKIFGDDKEETASETANEATEAAEVTTDAAAGSEGEASAEAEEQNRTEGDAPTDGEETAETAEVEESEPTEPEEEYDPKRDNPSFFPVGEQLTGDVAQFFSGKTYLNHLVPRGGPIINMTFEPGCRTNWHVHHAAGQVLLVTGGAGWYQEEGREPRPLRPGDVVNVPAEIKHWHGAAKDAWFAHLLIPIAIAGATNAFLEKVPDEEYDALPPAKGEEGSIKIDRSSLMSKLFGKE